MSKRNNGKAGAQTPATDINDAAQRVLDAIRAETQVFRHFADDTDGAGDPACDAACGAVGDAVEALLAIPKADVFAHMAASGSMDYVMALALIQRRYLVMEAEYQNIETRPECLLVDLLLEGTTAGNVPLLWHVSGDPRSSRPDDAELQAGWIDHDRQEAA